MPNLNLALKTIKTENPAFVMAIVNADRDSFFAKSRGGFRLAKKHIDEGADIIDVGGESTRPGSGYIDAKEEIKRVVPVIKKIRAYSNIPISVDTRKYDVMSAAYDAGADILNDVSALEDDSRLAKFAAENNFEIFTSTLFYSVHQNHELMKKIAESCAKNYGVKFYYEDFREGWQRGIDLSLELELYRQNYCGCIFSEEERFSKEIKNLRKSLATSKI